MENEDKVMAAIHLALGKKPDRFKPVKDFLYRVKDAKRKVHLIEERIDYREESIGAHVMSIHHNSRSQLIFIILKSI